MIQWSELTLPQRVEAVGPLIQRDGKSYSEIAALLNTSRVAIAGFANRQKLRNPALEDLPPKDRGGAAHRKQRQAKARTNAKVKAKAKVKARRHAPPAEGNNFNRFTAIPLPPDAIDRSPPRPTAFNALPGTSPRPLDYHVEGECRWPVGEALHYCCAPTEGHKNYCPSHVTLGTRPPAPPRLKRKKSRYA